MRTSLRNSRGTERGSAVVVVLALLVAMGTLLIGNAIALRQLKQELRLIERRQQIKIEKLVATEAHLPGAQPAAQ